MARLRGVDGVVPAVLADGERGGPGGGAGRSIDMDAVKFIEERNRMCGTMSEMWGVDAAQIVKNTEEWSAAHPRKTRQSVLLEQWANCMVDRDGTVGMCPRNVDKNYICDLNRYTGCPDCRREFWMQEVE